MRQLVFTVGLFTALPFSLFGQTNISFRSNLNYYPTKCSNVWGYVDSTNGHEYALVGLYNGVSIVDVTNPDSIYQVQFIGGASSTWRNMKTWKHYAYVTNETNGGLLIIDLSQLPSHVDTISWSADTVQLATAHTMFIDEHGYAYINGFNNQNRNRATATRGVLIADLNQDPWHPVYKGQFNKQYVHDCFVRGDTLWAAEIYYGNFEVIDVTDKTHPVELAIQETPSKFTHNIWLSDDNQTAFTTDEVTGAYIASYDVSNISNISEDGRYQSSPASGVIPHNTYYFNHYLVNSYYKDGVTIVDAHDPKNLIQTGNYDTSPFPAADGYNGCWGVYPFLPSGNILASDIEEGLFVLTPTFTRAAYLMGTVTDSIGTPLPNARIAIINDNKTVVSDNSGNFRTGIGQSGVYDVRVTAEFCPSLIVSNVNLQAGDTTFIYPVINCIYTGIDANTDNAVVLTASTNGNQLAIRYQLPPPAQNCKISLFDMSGRLMRSWPIETQQGFINYLNMPSHGLYLVKLEGTNVDKTTKVFY